MVDPSNSRAAQADQYFTQELSDQRQWYGKRATSYKRWAQLLGFVVIAAGTATSFFQVFTPAPWVPPLTAGLGALVALSEGWQRIARYGETWVAYRTASERMKRERRLYVNSAGAYRGSEDEAAFLQFVENIEAILAEEQQIFWRGRSGEGGQGGQSVATIPKENSEHVG